MEDHTFAADTLVEEREAVMHPPCGGNPTLRKAHFLKPLFGEDHDHFPSPPSSQFSSKPICKKVKKYNLHSYKNYPSEKWKIWVHSLKPKYEEIWKQAGIYEAILASTYKIPKDKDLIMALAERWCGALYLTPLADECVGIFNSLKKAHREIKLLNGKHVSPPRWMEYFMCSGKELEHEAFLAMWLSSDMRAALDSGKETFVWRPYGITLSSCMLSKLYGDHAQWVVVEDDEAESYARCLRVSELVGLDIIEQYLPHRVAMQFGLDQDVPPHVIRSNKSPKTAWNSYNRSFKGTKIYIPPRLFESDISSRYVVWWRGLVPVNEEVVNTYTLVEEREVAMYLPSDENPTRTKAHFLKPLFSEHDDHFPPPPSSLLSSEANFKLLKNSNLHSYKSSPSEKWKIWVLSLKPKYQEIWKQAGALYLTPLADEGVGIFDCLKSAYDEVRLLSGGNVIASMWMEYFLRGSKELEHEAFLAMWLSRSARWNGVKIRKVRDVRKALDSEKDSFLWRPYVITSSNCTWSKLYRDSEQWLVVESEDAESLARCLRVSELVGLDYIEQYLPHRVAMQFGLDQDIPPHVMRSNGSPKTAWSTYKRSIRGTQLYIPPRHFQSNVSSRYVVWWRGLLPANKEIGTTCIRNEKHFPLISWGQKRRRSRKMESFGKRNNLDGMLVVKTYCGTETPAKLICLTEAVTSGVQSKSSSDKCKERISSTERPINLKEDAVVSDGNQVKVNEATAELANDVVRKVNSPDNHIVNIEEKSCGSTTSELAHLGLMARILRLEKIVDAIKAAKRDANSGGNFEH
ncbi:hypothetical protein ACET3Z_014233 [Daucus carota]